jgi:hypothetical protein
LFFGRIEDTINSFRDLLTFRGKLNGGYQNETFASMKSNRIPEDDNIEEKVGLV